MLMHLNCLNVRLGRYNTRPLVSWGSLRATASFGRACTAWQANRLSRSCPAALKVNLPLLAPGALIVLNIDSFTSRGLAKAGYQADPRTSGALDSYQVVEVDMTELTMAATESFGLSKSDAGRCKNFWALGLVQWMLNHDIAPIEDWITKRFTKDATIRDANLAALRAGHAYGQT